MPDATYKLAVFEHGTGKPIILLHGIISTHRYWNQVIELIDSSKWLTISPDLLGFGDSPKPKDATYTLQEQVGLLRENIGNYTTEKSILVGHSMGAGIALSLAITERGKFNKLILTSLPMLRPDMQYRQLSTIIEADLFKTESIAKAGVHALNWVNAVPEKLLKKHNRWPEHIVEDWKKHSRDAYRKIMKGAVHADQIIAELKKIDIPTTIIIGKKDGMIDEWGMERLNELSILNKKIKIQIVNSGHNVPLEQPEMVAKAILQV